MFSDSHYDINICCNVINKLPHTDMIIHAGDCKGDAERLARLFPDIEIKSVPGNCDFSSEPQEMCFTAAGKRIFLTHGHKYGVKTEHDYRSLVKKAKEENADAAVFGHTHITYLKKENGILLLNPGSIKYGNSFGIIEIEDGKMSADICSAGLWF